MRFEFKSVGLWSVVKVAFVVNLILGFVLGLIMAVFLLPFIALMSSVDPSAASGIDTSAFGGTLMIVILPIMYALGNAVFGTIMVFFGALIYNMAARLLGGIEYEVGILEAHDLMELVQGPPATPATGYYQPPQQQAPYQPTPPPPPPVQPTPPPPPPPPPSEGRPPDNHPDRPEGL